MIFVFLLFVFLGTGLLCLLGKWWLDLGLPKLPNTRGSWFEDEAMWYLRHGLLAAFALLFILLILFR